MNIFFHHCRFSLVFFCFLLVSCDHPKVESGNMLISARMVGETRTPQNGTGVVPASYGELSKRAFEYLEREMDIFHKETVIFDDLESGAECFFSSGWMKGPNSNWPDQGDNRLQFSFPTSVMHGGASCLRIQWAPPREDQWVAVAWQYPEKNWGSMPGRNLQGATRLSFWAKGEKGTEWVEFKFAILHDPTKKFNDSCPELSTGLIHLPNEWRKYEIDLSGRDLTNVISGFCFAINKMRNPDGCTFYLDDISINHPRLSDPRLIRSFNVGMLTLPQKEHLRNTCFVYDNALAVCAFLSSQLIEHQNRARLIADALVQLSSIEQDGSIHNAYATGDLFRVSADSRVGRITRMPVRKNRENDGLPPWLEDTYSKGVDCGNMAWVMLALLNVWDVDGQKPDSKYLSTAERMGEWILAHARDNDQVHLGFKGGEEWNREKGKLEPVTWNSTEHNIDLAAAFARLAQARPDPERKAKWEAAAEHARRFVLWAHGQGTSDGGRLVTGTLEGSDKAALMPKPLDPQTWSILAFPKERHQFEQALNWAILYCRVQQHGIWGYQFSAGEGTDIWPEGTAQVALALRAVRRYSDADAVLSQLELIMTTAESVRETPGAMPAAYPKKVLTGFKWDYEDLPHLGATAWYLLAKNGWNPYTAQTEP